MELDFVFPRVPRVPRGSLFFLCVLCCFVVQCDAQTVTREQAAFFEQNIRPILVTKCGNCHSETAPKIQGGVLLDNRAGWQKGGTNGVIVVAGDAKVSRLMRAVRHEAGIAPMPPNGKLSEKEIAALTQWIAMGAPDPRDGKPKPVVDVIARGRNHWAFQPIKRSAPPNVKRAAWAKTPIDRFLLADMEKKGVAPNPYANRRTLIRRVTLDLTGLPPTPEEVTNFVADKSPDAWARVLDRLLASPQYGERWGRHWLDLARFAESHGFEHDYDRPTAYPYRDFIIKALNADMPYNQFVAWQLAGDELMPDDPMALAATGFLAAGVHSTQITKNQVEKERYDELDDMLATTGTAMLGLTLGCARCHDHKYDPIPTKDYYRMLSTFTTTVRSEVDIEIDKAADRKALMQWEVEHKPLTEELARYERTELMERFGEWLRNPPQHLAFWEAANVTVMRSEGGAILTKQADGSITATGKNPDFDTYILTIKPGKRSDWSLRIVALPDASLPQGGPGRAPNGNFALTDVKILGAGEKAMRLASAVADFEQAGLTAKATIDSDPRSAWAVDPQFNRPHYLVIAPAEPRENAEAFQNEITVVLKFNNNTGHNFGRFRVDIGSEDITRPVISAAQCAAYDKILSGQAVNEAERALLLPFYREQVQEWKQRFAAVQEHLRTKPKPTVQKTLISTEGLPAVRLHTQGGDFLPETHFLKRGDPTQKGDVMTQGFLTILDNAPDREARWQTKPPQGWRTSYRRKAFAAWLTDTQSGAGQLLARVIVNRLWQHHFGKGLVRTPSDFGAMGERPSNPALLDWLAAELIRNGWKLKSIHRLMLTSAAYQQSAAQNPTAAKSDPDNHLFARFNRQRLEAEAVRDSMLAVSGTLDKTPFGTGTLDEDQTRRSIYFTVKRSKLIPSLHVFDAPDALQGIGFRQTTTVAPQALLLLNSKRVRGYARNFALRVMSKTGAQESVRAAYEWALARLPLPSELADAQVFLRAQSEAYRNSGKADAEVLALTDFCQALFSLNEFLFVE